MSKRTFTVEIEMPADSNEPAMAVWLQNLLPGSKVRPLSQKSIPLSKAIEFIEGTNGRIFSIRFIKRTNGEERYLTGRMGVKTKLEKSPTKDGTDWKAHDLICVFDMQKDGYRSIPTEGIREILIKGEWFSVVNDLQPLP